MSDDLLDGVAPDEPSTFLTSLLTMQLDNLDAGDRADVRQAIQCYQRRTSSVRESVDDGLALAGICRWYHAHVRMMDERAMVVRPPAPETVVG